MHAPRKRIAALVAGASTLIATPSFAAHTYDLATTMPPRLSIMFSMGWFGVSSSDPQGAGGDKDYSLWSQQFPTCSLSNDPATCADFPDAGLQRSIASKRRPLVGIYSSSGRTPESLREIDLMLSSLRRPCDLGGGFDAFAGQIDSIQFTSKYPQNKQSATWDIAYRNQVALFERADAAGLTNAVVAGHDSTDYWHFGSAYGLTTQTQRKAALTSDLADLATIAASHASSVKINGKPLLATYIDAQFMTAAEWQTILDDARTASGVDFYILGSTLDTSYFAAFDALTPWVNLGIWASTQPNNANLHDRALAYAGAMHAGLLAAAKNFPGRTVFGGVAPGFDDYTQEWGACNIREIPRDPAVLAGQMDYFVQLKQSGTDVRGFFFQTWDDWTEGSEFEPDVTEGTMKLLALRRSIGSVFGDAPDPAGEAALTARWVTFGQPRNCCFAGGACSDAGTEPVQVRCLGGDDAGADGGVAPLLDGGSAAPDATLGGDGASPSPNGAGATPGDSAGCGCSAAGRASPLGMWSAFVVVIGATLRRRRA